MSNYDDMKDITPPVKNRTIILHHSADYDGLFSGHIAKKFLPDAETIGWDFPDKPLQDIHVHTLYVIDLPVDRPFGLTFDPKMPFVVDETATKFKFGSCTFDHVIWIDHHKTSIDTHPTDIPGYRIDGVAACRLAWQWFIYKAMGRQEDDLPTLEEYKARKVIEPVAVTLAGEYDIWCKDDPRAETFQFGLRSRELASSDWECMLQNPLDPQYRNDDLLLVERLLIDGKLLQRYQQKIDSSVVRFRSFLAQFEGLNLLCLNTARCNSLTFAALDVPETGHDALCGFYWNGRAWTFSLYHANHRKDLDLSEIARKHGGGGHRGACGFPSKTIPFEPRVA